MSAVSYARRRAAAVFLFLLILASFGVWEILRLPSAIFPSVTFPVVRVIANAGEEPAIGVIPTLTRPLEDALLRIPGIKNVRSVTSRGSVELTAQFHWGTDMHVALQRAQAETQRVRPDLPANTSITVKWMNPAVFPILGYSLTSDQMSDAQLRELAEYALKPELVRVPGVSQVQVQGGHKREFRVDLDPAALQGRHLSVDDVIQAIKKDNIIKSTGLVPRYHELYLSVVDGEVHGLADLKKISVPVSKGVPALLSELGQITSDDEVSFIRTTANGRPAVLINILRQPSANTVAIEHGIRQVLKSHPDLLPKSVQWSAFYNQARFVSASVGGTRDAILIGVILAALVLLVFLQSWRLALIAVVNLPLTVAIAGLGLSALHQTVNLMTLAGVAAALGLIADDAIVVIENIDRERKNGGPLPVQRGIAGIFTALVGSSLSTTLILVPFAMLSGVVGAFFKPLAFTMALTLVISFFLAWILVPLNTELFGPKEKSHPGKLSRLWQRLWAKMGGRHIESGWRKVSAWWFRHYRRTTGFFVHKGWVSVLLLVVLMGGAYWFYRRLGTNFLPSMDEGSIILDYWTPPGTSLDDTNRMLNKAETVILQMPDVASYSRRTGTQLGFFTTEPNRGDYVIDLKPRGRRRPIDEVISELRKRIAAIEPAIHTDFGQLLEDNIGDLSGGTPQPVDVKVLGSDESAIQGRAKQIAKIVTSVTGTADVFDGIVISGPTLRTVYDPQKAARFQLTASDLHTAVAAATHGLVASQVRVGDRTYDLRVSLSSASASAGAAELAKVKIVTPSGALIAVGDVAQVHPGAPESEIDRENLKDYVGITARLSGTSLGTAMKAIRSRISSKVSMASNMRVEYGGQYEQQQTSFHQLLFILLAGLVLVAVVVLFEFADWRAPIITVFCALAVLAGVFLALQLTGRSLNISSYVGAIMMVGIVGENAIFVIHEAREELRRGKPPPEAWIHASERRLRPVAMTILATSLALAPLALAVGQGSQLMQPLAIAVIGGFVLSGPVVLLLVPGLYRLMDPNGRLAGR